MRTLTWKPIYSNLREAFGELSGLYGHLYYLAFGQMPDGCDDSCKEDFERREKKCPLREGTLYASLAHAYYHLNLAWNARRTSEERAWNFSDEDAKRWDKFPKTKAFADLWLPKSDVKNFAGEMHHRKSFNVTTVRVGVQLATRKLQILCYLVAKEVGDTSSWSVRPEGLEEKVGSQPLTENEFARRLHRIYAEMNYAWNSRNDKTFVRQRQAVLRRRCFSPFFMVDC